jgi:hypothetical protein
VGKPGHGKYLGRLLGDQQVANLDPS